jgi:hypothetical protein
MYRNNYETSFYLKNKINLVSYKIEDSLGPASIYH